jgi:hypothetical protein
VQLNFSQFSEASRGSKHGGQSDSDITLPTQVKIQTQKDQTCIETFETGKKDISTVGEEEEQNRKPPDLPNVVAGV